MADNCYKLEDEVFPSFLYKSLDSTSGRATLENVTLGIGPGLPVAASTVAKIRPASDNRQDHVEASYLEGKELQQASTCSSSEQAKFFLNFKDDMDNADDFIAAHRISDLLVKINLDDTVSKNQTSILGPLPTRRGSVHDQPTVLATDLSTGLLTLAHSECGASTDAKAGPAGTAIEDKVQSEGVDSDHFSGSNSSFLANERLMSVDSMNSDLTDDDIDLNNLPEDELDQYFNKLVPSDMQRGRVEGQEIPATDMANMGDDQSNPSSTEPDQFRQHYLDNYHQMPDVRQAATGMDSCPASDEDTEDELESARRRDHSRMRLLPSTSRQLVGESHHPSFRPGLEGGSSDDEASSNRGGPSVSGLEHRRSAEGRVINPPVTGDGGGGDGSSGSEDGGNDGGVSTMPLSAAPIQTTYDVLRGLGIVGEDQASDLQRLMGDRVGPVGTGEASSSHGTSGTAQRGAPVDWSMTLDRQEALDAMEHTATGPMVDRLLDSLYLRGASGSRRVHDSVKTSVSHLQGAQESFHLSQVGFPDNENNLSNDEGIDEPDGCRPSLGIRGGPCGNASAAEASDSASEDDHNQLSTSLEPKYFSQSLHQDDSDDGWTNCPETVELEFKQGAKNGNSVVYQNEQGQWVTDLAYYSSFEKEVGEKAVENEFQEFQDESFVAPGDALEKIAKDQEEFEKEHQFMQEEKIEPAPTDATFQGDSSWKIPSSSYILMRASQVSDLSQADQSYLRLSLGQFFGQRSEALGSLGRRESADDIKRPSFGYVITSPEKREPFALIPPSELADASPHNATVDLDADKTLNPEDLDKTLEAPREAVEPETGRPEETLAAPKNIEDPDRGNQSCVSPDCNSSNLMLSISTIASAIADASISTDPSQLAAMIMELSKRRKPKAPSEARPMGTNTAPQPKSDTYPVEEQSIMMEKSAFDMDKYLKKTELSGGSEASLGQTTFNLTGWADELNTLNTAQKDNTSCQIKQAISDNMVEKPCASSNSNCGNNSDPRHSSIPRLRSSYRSQKFESSGHSSTENPQETEVSTEDSHLNDNGGRMLAVKPQASGIPRPSVETLHNKLKSPVRSPGDSPDISRSPSGRRRGPAGVSSPNGELKSAQKSKRQEHPDGPKNGPPLRSAIAAPLPSNVEKHVGFKCLSVQSSISDICQIQEPFADETHSNFRPSTSPLTHSSPSQTSFPSVEGMSSPPSSRGGQCDKSSEYSPKSTCSSPSLSRLTYVSLNDGTLVPSPEKQKGPKSKNDSTMALSTTIIRSSPTPPLDPDQQSSVDNLGLAKSLDPAQPHAKSLNPIPPQSSRSPCGSRSGSVLACSRTQSECNYQCTTADKPGNQKLLPDSNVQPLTKVDSGYLSNLNIQHSNNATAPPGTQQWVPSCPIPPVYGPSYVPISSFKPQCNGMVDLPLQGDLQPFLSGRSPFMSQLPQHYLGLTSNGLYGAPLPGIPNSELTGRLVQSVSTPLAIPGAAGPEHLSRPLQSQPDRGLMGKPYTQFGAEALFEGLEDLRAQVVVPEEIRFPNACCVGIASQTSLSLYNPSERWQQVSISLTSLSIDGEKVDILPYQWLIVKNKTIIGPKTTEDQKVMFIPPQPGVYQCVLSVCSWPASAESNMAARAKIFAKKVVLVAIAENPAIEIEVGKAGCLDFGDLPVGGAKSLALTLLNRTHATVPIRLVLSANASAWRCFSLSKNPVTMTCEVTQAAGHITPMSPQAVMNHVMHASYGENPERFVVWVHFKAPTQYPSSSEDLGLPDEFVARVDVEVDSPGPTHVIRSVPLRARSGTARVHAPKDLQTLSLTAPVGKSSQQMLPLKNAGNIDVQLKLKCSGAEGCFSVTPNELCLKVGEEQSIVISFKAQENCKAEESLLTILVLPSGPQYEVTLKGEVAKENSGKRAISSSSVLALANDVPPILSNKQFVAWGGVTLGRAIQQKLVLRNNSKTEIQQLRLLIRGQDQDCFQLQSMFSPEERLTRHGELSIRPTEDVTVHLLFAPTRIACMLAKLEIKQSGVRPSQPGIKFTIPLSGYGGTSNIILEDQRKQADGYVATVADVAVGRVCKVCVCVRNTGSRAAFIKAVAYTDLQKQAAMEASVISIAPSQFVLKERTQEVITILMKCTQRELSLCQFDIAQLATLCLFCGDEVSRQQYRKLLQSKPDAGRKALSENSLLKNIVFNEKFLGEEIVTEKHDLPLWPNEAHLFYGKMSKVVVSIMGSTKSVESMENSPNEESLPSTARSSASDSGLTNGNVSLDVLPVKGPQGTGLTVPEPSLKASEVLHKPESWTIHPEQLLLPAPTINGPSATSTVQIRNNTSRELSFDLSWPAHCLTITPQHGVIEPQSHLQILISPNPSLANKSSLLPWSGQIYVQCDGQQKFIKVQIRQDLVLDVSAATGDSTLSALAPQAATPVVHLPRGPTKPLMSTQPAPELLKIRNKTIVFPATPSGETSEAQLEVENGDVDFRWYLSSFAPPYVKGVDTSGDVYRATYTAFRCSGVSGTLGAHEKMQVPITFLPRDRGEFAQFWDLECHSLSEPQQKTSIRFQLSGTGTKSGSVEGPHDGDCSLVKTEPTVKTMKTKVEPTVARNSAVDGARRGVYSPQDLYTFPATRVGESSSLKVSIRNNSTDTHELKFVSPREPFHINHSKYLLRSQHYLRLLVHFRPTTPGRHTGVLLVQSGTSGSLVIHLAAEAVA